jgi:hypothetical protein
MFIQNTTSISPYSATITEHMRGSQQEKFYRVILKEQGRVIEIWERINAPDALTAINQVAANQLSSREWTAIEIK